MSLLARAAALTVAVLVVAGIGIFVAVYYIGSKSQLTNVAYTAANGQVNVVLQEDPQNNSSSKPDWVSYFVQDPKTHRFIHTTLFSIPEHVRR